MKNHSFRLLPSVFSGKGFNEIKMTQTFMAKSRQQDLNSDNYKEWLFLMQHHGLPTRMLDWTESCLVALYFAINTFTEEEISSDDINDPIVWMLNPLLLNIKEKSLGANKFPNVYGTSDKKVNANCKLAFDDKKDENATVLPIAIKTRWIDDRMSSQKSCFTIHGTEKIPLENLIKDDSDHILTKYIINKARIKDILNQLKLCGITHYTVFPDLDGLSREIRKEFKL